MPPLRIGVNALYLIPGGVGGTEIYLRSLLAAMAEIDSLNRYFVFVNRETGADLAPPCPAFTTVRLPVRAVHRASRILWEQTVLPAAAALRGIDVMFNPGFTAPLYCACPNVTVFHDLQYVRHPEYFAWLDLLAWRALLPLAALASEIVVAVSEATAADLRRYFRMPDRKLRVAAHGVDPEFFAVGRRRRPEPFLLTVSTLHPHKGLDTLLEAFAEFRTRRPCFRLVVAGLRGFAAAGLERRRDALGLSGAVEFTGWIPRDRLYGLYARAFAFVFPSRFEGFGMPVLEAMAAGIPTVCSDIEPLREVSGGAALRFPPGDAAALLDAMLRLAGDETLRLRLEQSGPVRAARYTWQEAARATLRALEEAAKQWT